MTSLVFVGFMGAGKSTAARIAAERLGVDPVDADTTFERRHGSIARFFEQHGEPEFRQREEAIVLELLREREGVLSLGGGAVESAPVREALREHHVAWIDTDL